MSESSPPPLVRDPSPDHSRRRRSVPFDPFFFEKRASSDEVFTLPDTFRLIYDTNHWAAEQRSGAGASAGQTKTLIDALALLIRELHVSTLLDLPCGDLSWMRYLDMPELSYIGGDIVPEAIAANRMRFSSPSRSFHVLDVTGDDLPAADLLLCRDCLVHLSFADARAALVNIARSPITHLLATTFPGCRANDDIVTGDWRPINLELPPFSLPPPARLIDERCTEGAGLYADKSLGLWRVDQLREPHRAS